MAEWRSGGVAEWFGHIRLELWQVLGSIPGGGMKKVSIYTDGSSRGNPGPGGYGTVLIFGKHEKRLSQGYVCTTNNRMEIMAALAGLNSLKEPCDVTIYSDSQYLVNAMTKGWMAGWKKNGWAKKKKSEELKNVDLWQAIDTAIEGHDITWTWVKGHAGNEYNEICDQLATEAADGEGKIDDSGFQG